jgi:hypothetical protein
MCTPDVSRLVEDHVVEVNRPAVQLEGVLVGTGQQQEVLDQVLEPQPLGPHALGQGHRAGPLRVRQGHLGVLAQAGHRGAELVGGVGDEPPLPLLGPLQAFEHAVHGGRQPGDLVAGGGRGHPAVQLAGRDLVHFPPDGVHGSEGPAHHLPGGDRHEHDQQRQPEGQQAGDHSGRPLHRLEGAGHDDGEGRAAHWGGLGRHRQELELVERPTLR